MKIIISPAKSIQIRPIETIEKASEPLFEKETAQLVKKLQKLSTKKLVSMMHVSTDIADLNVERYRNWDFSLGESKSKNPAISSFTGEVYRGLDADSLSEEGMQFAQENLRILSGLFGLLRPFDLMQPYRLEMGTSWAVTPKTKNLYQFWGNKIALQLSSEMMKDEVLINLASTEYFKAIDLKSLKRQMITPVFKELKNGEYKVVMTYAKNARGKMTRYIVENKLEHPEEIKGFDLDGYRFHEALSSESEWVFTR
ncbi:MAG: peroxide stress protein YaaA [Bacteroidetes bacterium]|nr:peroxide stress protein YaaA [Bacteroidota bacterium]